MVEQAGNETTGQRAVDLIAIVFDRVAESLAQVEHALHDQLDADAGLIAAIGDHVFASGGKRLRPLLTLASARLCGYEGDKHIGLAAAVEFIHTATLLHDDVVDESDLRRGRLDHREG